MKRFITAFIGVSLLAFSGAGVAAGKGFLYLPMVKGGRAENDAQNKIAKKGSSSILYMPRVKGGTAENDALGK